MTRSSPPNGPSSSAPGSVTPDELSRMLSDLEDTLQALGSALRCHDADTVSDHAHQLHRALGPAVDHFSRAARQGQLPPALRQRLVRIGGQVASHRLAMNSQQRVLDRALALLMPGEQAPGAAYHVA
jgi:ABC-type transporter Mla subunit MlaD